MKSTTRFSTNKRGIECLNCKQPISDKDNFCSNCGQINDLKPLNIKKYIIEFFSGFFSFDTRFLKTFIPLLFKPGKVSEDYIEGKRKKYVNPFQLYLNVTIVFFLLQGLFSTINEYNGSEFLFIKTNENSVDLNLEHEQTDKNNNSAKDSALLKLPISKTNDSSIVHNLQGRSKNKILPKNIKQNIIFRIDSIFATTDLLENLKSDSISINKKDSIYEIFYKSYLEFISKQVNNDAKNDDWDEIKTMSDLSQDTHNYVKQFFKSKEVNYTIPEQYSLRIEDNFIKSIFGNKIRNFVKYNEEHIEASTSVALEDLGVEKTRLNAFLYRISQNINKFKNDPSFRKSYTQSIISKISVALFFLLPIFTLFLSLLYIRRKWNYTEHLVFVFNVQTVFFLILILFIIFDRILKTDLGIGLFIPVFLFYLFRALLNFYKQHWFKTTIKFVLLNIFYLILSLAGLIVVSFIAFVL